MVQDQPTFDATSGIVKLSVQDFKEEAMKATSNLLNNPGSAASLGDMGYLDTSFRGENHLMYMKFEFTREDYLAMRTLCNNLKVVKYRTERSPEQLDQLVEEGGYTRVYFTAVPKDIGEHFVKKTGRLHVRGGHMTGDTSQKSTGFFRPKRELRQLELVHGSRRRREASREDLPARLLVEIVGEQWTCADCT